MGSGNTKSKYDAMAAADSAALAGADAAVDAEIAATAAPSAPPPEAAPPVDAGAAAEPAAPTMSAADAAAVRTADMPPEWVESLTGYFTAADVDGSGDLHYLEFMRLVQNLGLELTAEQVGAVCESADVSTNGTVSLGEFLKAAPLLYPQLATPDSVQLGWQIRTWFGEAGWFDGVVKEGPEPSTGNFYVRYSDGEICAISPELVVQGRAEFAIWSQQAAPSEAELAAEQARQDAPEAQMALIAQVVHNARDEKAARASLRIALRKVFESFDKDGSKQLDQIELARLCDGLQLGLDSSTIMMMMEGVDVDASGTASSEEMIPTIIEYVMDAHFPKEKLDCNRMQ